MAEDMTEASRDFSRAIRESLQHRRLLRCFQYYTEAFNRRGWTDSVELDPTITGRLAELEKRLLAFEKHLYIPPRRQAAEEAAWKHQMDAGKSGFLIRERMIALEERLLEVEKRLNMPPAS